MKNESIAIERLYLVFLVEKPSDEKLESILKIDISKDRFEIMGNEVFVCYFDKMSNSKLTNNFFESKLKVRATTRNWKTVTKLIEIISN